MWRTNESLKYKTTYLFCVCRDKRRGIGAVDHVIHTSPESEKQLKGSWEAPSVT